MSATDDTTGADRTVDAPTAPAQGLDLTFAYDDPADPGTVTVFPEETEARTTTWISADVDHAVALEDAR